MANGIYGDNGIRYTSVPGTSWTGLYAADGSVNVVLDDVTYKGLYHPCGAWRVNSGTNTNNQTYDASGAYYLSTLLGGTSRPWTPAVLGSTVVGWWDASVAASITLNSTTIAGIADQSVSANNLSQPTGSQQPTYNATGINGKGAAVFPGGTGAVNLPTSAGFVLAQPNTVISLFQTGASNPTFEGVWDGSVTSSGNREILFGRRNDLGDVPCMFAGTLQTIGGAQLSTNTPYLHVGFFNGASSSSGLNGANPTTNNPGTFGIANGFSWGANTATATSAFLGSHGITVIVNRALTTLERQKLEGYAAWQFGLNQVVLPSNHPYFSVKPTQ